TAQMGGVCTLVNSRCCTYVDNGGKISTDSHTIGKHAKMLHEVTKDDTMWTTDLWEALTSWLPDLNWLKQLFMGILAIILFLLFTGMYVQCVWWCCPPTSGSYSDWKIYKIRYKIEKGTYFKEA
ncbi:ERVV2 protein, partial [Notiomystis cincta]|nr:ERVV2 protein [Notiomystis cincta]